MDNTDGRIGIWKQAVLENPVLYSREMYYEYPVCGRAHFLSQHALAMFQN